ncbi:tyrosine-type recombinase/integrase [Aeoliella sp. SH292]|uniref:tyrosine-type recombinase/integrase n=1 Tax=Aeoliella sp. SH292 TaxID=3454464 RepID=UPI003F9CFDD4
MSEINVHILKRAGRNVWLMRYFDPYTRKHVTKSSGCEKKKEAEKAAGVWESELRRGVYVPTARCGWEEFIEHYKASKLNTKGEGTATTYLSTVNVFQKHAKPERLSDFTTERITRFVADCRKAKLSEATIARHLRTLKVLARWAVKQGLLGRLPEFDMPTTPKGASKAKGRALTVLEFNELLLKVPQVLEADDRIEGTADDWRFYLKGLWCSGLRLRESLALSWTDGPGAILVDYSGKFPVLRIPGEAQKSGADQTIPVVPEFARLLDTVPPEARSGPVFAVGGSRFIVGRVVAAIGKAAGVVVHTKSGNYASAHDLRRSFGRRWSRKVMPAVLMELMRHASINTTMQFYVGVDAQQTAAELWAAETVQGVRLGDRTESEESEPAENAEKTSTGGGT